MMDRLGEERSGIIISDELEDKIQNLDDWKQLILIYRNP
jgi:hypothetical protein